MEECLPFIKALGQTAGIAIDVSPSGAVRLDVGGRGLLLQWLEARKSFVAYAEIGRLSGIRDSVVLRELLSANFLLQETAGAALSFDPSTGTAGLNLSIPVNGLDTAEFVDRIDALLLPAEEWAGRLRSMCEAEEHVAVDLLEEISREEGDAEAAEAAEAAQANGSALADDARFGGAPGGMIRV